MATVKVKVELYVPADNEDEADARIQELLDKLRDEEGITGIITS